MSVESGHLLRDFEAIAVNPPYGEYVVPCPWIVHRDEFTRA